MQSRSFKYALRAAIRACLVAASTASTVYADWNAPTLSIPVSCMVHDSGMEFLPIQFHPIDPSAHDDGFLAKAPFVRESHSQSFVKAPCGFPLDRCIAMAQRSERIDQLLACESWIENFGRRSMTALSFGTLQLTRVQGQVLKRWNQSIPSILDRLADSRRDAASTLLPSGESVDVVSEMPAPFDVCSASEFATPTQPEDKTVSQPAHVERSESALVASEANAVDTPEANRSPANHYDRCIGSSDVDMSMLCPDNPHQADGSTASNGTGTFGILPSGQPANMFVFTLSGSDLPNDSATVDSNRCSAHSLPVSPDATATVEVPLALTEFPADIHEATSDYGPYDDIEVELAEQTRLSTSGCTPVQSQDVANIVPDEEQTVLSPESFVAHDDVEWEPSTDMVPTTNESELCLPPSRHASQCGPGLDQTTPVRDRVGDAAATGLVEPPPNDVINSQVVDMVSGWRTLFRPDSCIFGPELAAANSVLFGGNENWAQTDELPIRRQVLVDSRPPTLEIPNDEPIGVLPATTAELDPNAAPTLVEYTHPADQVVSPMPISESSVRFTPSTWLGVAAPIGTLVNTEPAAAAEPVLPEPTEPCDFADDAKELALQAEQGDAPEPGFVAIASKPAEIGLPALQSCPAVDSSGTEPLLAPNVPSIQAMNAIPTVADPIAIDLPIPSLAETPVDPLAAEPVELPIAPTVTVPAEIESIDFMPPQGETNQQDLWLSDENAAFHAE